MRCSWTCWLCCTRREAGQVAPTLWLGPLWRTFCPLTFLVTVVFSYMGCGPLFWLVCCLHHLRGATTFEAAVSTQAQAGRAWLAQESAKKKDACTHVPQALAEWRTAGQDFGCALCADTGRTSFKKQPGGGCSRTLGSHGVEGAVVLRGVQDQSSSQCKLLQSVRAGLDLRSTRIVPALERLAAWRMAGTGVTETTTMGPRPAATQGSAAQGWTLSSSQTARQGRQGRRRRSSQGCRQGLGSAARAADQQCPGTTKQAGPSSASGGFECGCLGHHGSSLTAAPLGSQQESRRSATERSGASGLASGRRLKGASEDLAQVSGGAKPGSTSIGRHQSHETRLHSGMGQLCFRVVYYVAGTAGRESSGLRFLFGGRRTMGAATARYQSAVSSLCCGSGSTRAHRCGFDGGRGGADRRTCPAGRAEADCCGLYVAGGGKDHGLPARSPGGGQAASGGNGEDRSRALTSPPQRDTKRVCEGGAASSADGHGNKSSGGEAPSMSSTPSLTGRVEQRRQFLVEGCVSPRHSVRDERDYTSGFLARFLGLRLISYEVRCEEIGIFSSLNLDARQFESGERPELCTWLKYDTVTQAGGPKAAVGPGAGSTALSAGSVTLRNAQLRAAVTVPSKAHCTVRFSEDVQFFSVGGGHLRPTVKQVAYAGQVPSYLPWSRRGGSMSIPTAGRPILPPSCAPVVGPDTTVPVRTPERKISSGPEPRSPSQIALMQAEHVRIIPEELRQVPVFTNPAVGYTWGQATGAAVSTYTVFDHVRHSRVARTLPQASLLEIAASAMSEAPFAVASIKVLADPLPGLPLPQLVLIERGRPPDELPVPWDLRTFNEPVRTIRHTSRQDRDDVIGSVERLPVRHRPLTREVAEGRVIVSDAVGILLEHLPANLHVIQYFRFAEYAQPGLPATQQPGPDQGTTSTTTAVRIRPATQEQPCLRLMLLRGAVSHSIEIGDRHLLLDVFLFGLLELRLLAWSLPVLNPLVKAIIKRSSSHDLLGWSWGRVATHDLCHRRLSQAPVDLVVGPSQSTASASLTMPGMPGMVT